MRFAITGDIHLKKWPDVKFTPEGVPLKLNEILEAFTFMCEYCVKNGIDQLYILGDVNDSKGLCSTLACVLFKKILDSYKNINFIIIGGNHDACTGGDHNNISSVELLASSNVKVITQPEVLDNITFIPWSKTIAQDIKDAQANDILLSHFALNSAIMGSGMVARTNIGPKDLKKFRKVFIGDFHTGQTVEHVSYVGSLIPLNRSEGQDEKRFIVVDSETLKFESVKIETNYRKYYTFDITEETNIKETLAEIKKLKEKGHFVILKKNTKDMPKELANYAENYSIIDNFEEDTQIRGINSSMTIADQMQKYLLIQKVPEYLKKKYMNIGNEILSKT